jgi:hypothetical protein
MMAVTVAAEAQNAGRSKKRVGAPKYAEDTGSIFTLWQLPGLMDTQ